MIYEKKKTEKRHQNHKRSAVNPATAFMSYIISMPIVISPVFKCLISWITVESVV